MRCEHKTRLINNRVGRFLVDRRLLRFSPQPFTTRQTSTCEVPVLRSPVALKQALVLALHKWLWDLQVLVLCDCWRTYHWQILGWLHGLTVHRHSMAQHMNYNANKYTWIWDCYEAWVVNKYTIQYHTCMVCFRWLCWVGKQNSTHRNRNTSRNLTKSALSLSWRFQVPCSPSLPGMVSHIFWGWCQLRPNNLYELLDLGVYTCWGRIYLFSGQLWLTNQMMVDINQPTLSIND